MKRIRDFAVAIVMPDVIYKRDVSGFHSSWTIALEAMQSSGCEVTIYDHSKLREVVVFSYDDRQLQQENEGIPPDAIRWVTTRDIVPTTNQRQFFANLNHTDFAWCWVQGAERDVPFRLSFLEKKAVQRPNGPAAFGLGVLEELRDMLKK